MHRNGLPDDYAAMKAERDALALTFAETCTELGCAQDNEAALMAIHALRERTENAESERYELARQVLANGYKIPWDRERCAGCGEVKEFNTPCAHTPGCPVALAERIVKGAGDGR